MTLEIQSKKQELEKMLMSVKDETIRKNVSDALNCFEDPSLHQIVTAASKVARKRGNPEIALKLIDLAYELNPDNAHFLVELCTNLSYKRQYNNAISKIETFLIRPDIDQIPQDSKDTIIVTYASMLKGVGRREEGIKLLEQLKSNRGNVIEKLCELYNINGDFEKTIKLINGIGGSSSPKMARYHAKALDRIGQTDEGVEILRLFKHDPDAKKLLEELQNKIGKKESAAKDQSSSNIVVHATTFTGNIAGHDCNITYLDPQNYLTILEKVIQNRKDIPDEDKKSISARIGDLVKNPWVTGIGTAAIVDVGKKMLGL